MAVQAARTRQEIVFIGVKLDYAKVCALLDEALLTDAEFAAGPGAWAEYPDPFPVWGELHEHV
ncbi:hypothetical protein [Nocardia beijingensis]|uniref:hypothetical protein n=1 Tax=Nocardia beijingensis TaxID=95162 RepID=UPI003F4D1DA7